MPAVCALLTAIEAADWSLVHSQLARDVLWTNAIEEEWRGPDAVVAMLRRDPPPAPPAYHEVDGDRISRWIDSPG